MPRFVVTSVTQSIDEELKALAERGAEVGALGALAREMATQLDAPDVSATAKATCGRVLLDALARIAETVPAERAADALDEIEARRAKRRAAMATAAG